MLPLPRLHALSTAVPEHRLTQADVVRLVKIHAPRFGVNIEPMLPVYSNAGIECRYSCVPAEWYLEQHGWAERNRLFVRNAVNLLERAARDAMERAGVGADDIGAVVAVSTTGIATPSLDALIMERLELRRDTVRLPVFGLGCAGGALGLARAAALAPTIPDKKVLFLVVELCALTFRLSDMSKSNTVATALFGDGAAAAILGCDGSGPAVGPSGEHTWPNSLDIMGWRVEDDGFGVLFSREIPAFVRSEYRAASDAFLAANGVGLDDIDALVCHPGGAKVIDALENAYELPSGHMVHARSVLRDYGNMSAPTVLFVLQRTLEAGSSGRHLVSALGPGFTAGFLMLDA